MKGIVITVTVLMLHFCTNAQVSSVDRLFKKYYGKKGFTTVLVNPDMFRVISKMEKAEGELEGSLGNIKRVRIIAQEKEFKEAGVINFMDEMGKMEFNEYKELMMVKEPDQEVLILAREDDGKLAELLILVGGDDNVLVSVEGRFTMKDLASLSVLKGIAEMDSLNGIMN